MQMESPATDVQRLPDEKQSQSLEVLKPSEASQPTAEPKVKPQHPGTERSEFS